MSKLPQQRQGAAVEIRKDTLQFSLWPLRKSKGGYALQSKLFATDPWPLIRRSIESRAKKPVRPAALAFLEQGHDFYRSAQVADRAAAKPLLLYYCFLNLAKAFVLTKGLRQSLDAGKHGLSEQRHAHQPELTGAYLDAYPSDARNINIFDELHAAISGQRLAGMTQFALPVLLPQIVPGHRLWAAASNTTQRFFRLHHADFLNDRKANTIWGCLFFEESDLLRFGITHSRFGADARLNAGWKEVKSTIPGLLCFEAKSPTSYTPTYVGQAVFAVTDQMKTLLWQVVTASDPYRKYYVYLCPTADRPFVLPQLLSIYAVMFYLGSITRYRPHHFDRILNGKYGPFIEAFLNDQPQQFIFLMASYFQERDVTRASLA